MTGLTESLSRFIADPGFDAIPDDAVRTVKTGFIDTLATMIAGQDEPVVRIVRQFVAARMSGVASGRTADERSLTRSPP